MNNAEVINDWIRIIWVFLYWKIAISKFIFWIVSVLIDNVGLVDVIYCFNQWFIGLLLFIYYQSYNFKQILSFITLSLWFGRLGGYLLFTRVFKKKKD